jgi:hypothetical protein
MDHTSRGGDGRPIVARTTATVDASPGRNSGCGAIARPGDVTAITRGRCDDRHAERVAHRLERPADGKVFVSPVDEAIRVRTGERGEDAL